MSEAVLEAKMYLSHINEQHTEMGKESETIEMGAVTSASGNINAQWSKWTPCGSLKLQVNNPGAFGQVKPGFYKVLLVPCGQDD